MAQFLTRIINHFATEIISKRLANSRTFQQFALRTHDNIEKAKRLANKPEEAEKLMRETMKKGEKAKEEMESIAASFERFKAALREELSRDFGGGSKPSSNSSSNTRVSGDRRTSRK